MAKVSLVVKGWPLLVLGVLGCPPATVVRDGREIPAAEASRTDLEEARKALAEGRLEEALQKAQAFTREFPQTDRMGEALALQGKILYEMGKYQEAVEFLRRLMTDFPSSPDYIQAAVDLGMSLAKLGRSTEALSTLQSVFDRLPDENRQAEIASLLAETYDSAGAPAEAIHWYTVLCRLRPDEGFRKRIEAQVTDIVDQRLSFLDTRKVVEQLRAKGERGFPADILTFKLAKIFFHSYEFEAAESTFGSFLAEWPGHPLSREAAVLLQRITERNKVEQNAIGVLLPLSGKYRGYGQQALEGIQLGVGIFEEQAGQGPVLVIRDTAGEPDKTAEAMEDLVFNEHVIAIVGPIFSSEAHAAAVKAMELSVPLIALSGKEDLLEIGDWVFRNFLTYKAQARTLVGYAMEKLGARRFAILYPNDTYGVPFANAFWDEVLRRKGEIRGAERYEPDAKNFAEPVKKLVGRYWLRERTDFKEEMKKIDRETKNKPLARKRAQEKLIKELRPEVDFDALFIPDYVDGISMIAPALAAEDIILKTESRWQLDRLKKSLGRDEFEMVYLLGGNGWNNPKVVEWANRYVQGAVFCDSFFAESTRPATQRFIGRFQSQFGRLPGWLEAQAFDTAEIVRGVVESKKPATRQAFRGDLLQVQGHEGATGRMRFLQNGEAENDLFLLTIKEDKIIEVGSEPAPNAG